jgi:hypothetical protein
MDVVGTTPIEGVEAGLGSLGGGGKMMWGAFASSRAKEERCKRSDPNTTAEGSAD